MARREIRRLLVANRGEIACRVIRAARELGIESVAVFSEQDRGLPHVRLADDRRALGGSTPAESYLAIDRLLAAAAASGCDALHPGYGFLSENAALASACSDAGLVFVGPPPAVLAAAGDKRVASERVAGSGVRCLPSCRGDVPALLRDASTVGLPLLVKAAGGGGGRGMRRVDRAEDIAARVAEASDEARRFFADGTVYLERLVARARHIEVQVLADDSGRIVALGDRDCSVQRRHQKLIEEAPSPGIDDALRAHLRDAAIAAARAVDYRGAGTVEFLLELDAAGQPLDFFFLEINARIQVEHPITELTSGEDIVAWQLRLARGETLSADLGTAPPNGHAIECRVCAETLPDFLPSSGEILEWSFATGPGIRIDAGYERGDRVPPEFDSLLAKLVAHGPDRETARRRLVGALRETTILGVDTNADFLAAALDAATFRDARQTTAFVAELLASGVPLVPAACDPRITAIAVATRARAATHHGGRRASSHAGPWSTLGAWDIARGNAR